MNKTEMLESVRWYLSQFGEIGKKEKKILEAMTEVDRAGFMPPELRERAYEDSAIGIGHGQTISQPSTVARMLQLLELEKGDRVLEIGAGSGWNAGLIGYIVSGKVRDKCPPPHPSLVLSLEIVDELFESAKEKLKKYKNVKVEQRDFRKLKQKFDKVIFTAGIVSGQERIIEEFALRCLKDSGALVCPYRSGPLIVIRKKDDGIAKEFTREEYGFVELVLL